MSPSSRNFNPRPPCGGRRKSGPPPLRPGHFNPRPPCGGRRQRGQWAFLCVRISIHAPRVGGDGFGRRRAPVRRRRFQSTPPVWGATIGAAMDGTPLFHFNPRPPCGGRPLSSSLQVTSATFQSTPPVWGATASSRDKSVCGNDFNPRPPCGGRHRHRVRLHQGVAFQSTPPVWGATLGAIGFCMHT